MEEKQVRKITLGFVLGWVFGVIFLLAGFVSIFSTGVLVGLLMMLMGFILLPPANSLLANKLGFVISGGLKFVLIIVLFVVIGIVAGDKAKEEGFTIKDTEDSVVNDTEEEETVETKKEYQLLTTFTGKGNKDTESFVVQSDKVKVVARTYGSTVGSFSAVDLECDGECGYMGTGLSISTDGKEEGTGETIYRDLDIGGSYYISVISGISWEVQIYQEVEVPISEN